MQKITPFLWFDNQAEEAARFYTSVFKNSEVGAVSHYGDGAPLSKGTVMTVAFTLDGQEFIALNGGPIFKFTEAVSFVVHCATQEEIDAYWERLTSGGGQPVQCGWLKDKYGLSWQIVPTILNKLVAGDPARASRVMQRLMTMVKLDIRGLQQAYDGE